MSHETRRYNGVMETKRFIYYEDDGILVGWLEEYPDYRTQGESMDELHRNLLEIFKDVTSGEIPCVRKVGELSIA
jgi:predicted RNase H-like HicB family nuclease